MAAGYGYAFPGEPPTALRVPFYPLFLAALTGLALGTAILTRATKAPFALFAVAWLAQPHTRWCPSRRGVALGLTCLAATFLILTPWLVRAHHLTGRWTLGTEFGAAVFAGNHPLTFSHFPRESIDLSRAAAFASLGPSDRSELARLNGDEAAQSDWYLARGLEWIATNPGATLQGMARKLVAAFGPLPVPRHGLLGDAVHALSFFFPSCCSRWRCCGTTAASGARLRRFTRTLRPSARSPRCYGRRPAIARTSTSIRSYWP